MNEPSRPRWKRTFDAVVETRQGWVAVLAALTVFAALVIVNYHGKLQKISIIDHIYWSSFAVFAVGFAVLLIVFVVQTILGKINLPQALQDKQVGADGQPGVSLSRLQAFLWTLVIMTTYFYEAVADDRPGLPAIPPELLMVMGISSAVYLTSKGMEKRREGP